MARNQGLAAFGALPGLPAALRAAQRPATWHGRPRRSTRPNLRRDNLFVRLAWQPDHWLLSADALLTPADRGRIVTLGVQWQGDRLRLNAVWRTMADPRTRCSLNCRSAASVCWPRRGCFDGRRGDDTAIR